LNEPEPPGNTINGSDPHPTCESSSNDYSRQAKTYDLEILFFRNDFGYAPGQQILIRMTQTEPPRQSGATSVPDNQSSRTSLTLLGRLRVDPRDAAAWDEFVARYEPKIFQWCLGWRLQESDARDVTQDVLLKLHRLLAKFNYDPSRSFRAWLKTLTHHAWRDLVDDRKRAGSGSGDSRMLALFENIEAGNDLDKHLKQEFHRELMEQAMGLVQSRVAARTWDAFRLTVLEECSGADAAARLEMTVARVYTSKSQVKRLIREEIRKLVKTG
jgi:RNA polymerase sigma-70 factor (ECF subfamily)